MTSRASLKLFLCNVLFSDNISVCLQRILMILQDILLTLLLNVL